MWHAQRLQRATRQCVPPCTLPSSSSTSSPQTCATRLTSAFRIRASSAGVTCRPAVALSGVSGLSSSGAAYAAVPITPAGLGVGWASFCCGLAAALATQQAGLELQHHASVPCISPSHNPTCKTTLIPRRRTTGTPPPPSLQTALTRREGALQPSPLALPAALGCVSAHAKVANLHHTAMPCKVGANQTFNESIQANLRCAPGTHQHAKGTPKAPFQSTAGNCFRHRT